MIEAGEISKIKSKFGDFDTILCLLSNQVSDLIRFNFIEKSDFFVLIGLSAQFDEYKLEKFSNELWEREKKCAGFFLID